jgi:hypothetical protein
LALSLFATLAGVAAVAITTSASVSPSTFQGGDGNLVVNTPPGGTDWASFVDANGDPNGLPAPDGLNVGIDNLSGGGDNSLGQGTKEDDPNVSVVSGSIPPQKSDLTRFYEASEVVNNNVFIYLAWERTNTLGSANMDFEINQNPSDPACPDDPGKCTINRTNGDVLVTYDFGGSGAPVIGILRWLVVGGPDPTDTTPPIDTNSNADCFSANKLPCWGDRLVVSTANSEGAVNTTTNNPPSGAVTDPILPDDLNACPDNASGVPTCPEETFGEASINLTGAGVITPSAGGCAFGQATTFLKSRSSASFPAELKDFIAPVQTPLINNCGAIKVTKTGKDKTQGSGDQPLAGATFEVKDPDGNVINDPGGNALWTTGADGTFCVSNQTIADDYTVEEKSAPTGYAIDDAGPVTVDVTAASTCDSGAATASFTDTPLTDLTVTVDSQADGQGTEDPPLADAATESSIQCTDGVDDVGNSPQPPQPDPPVDPLVTANPVTVTATGDDGLPPGTYTCTVVIDP